MPDFNSLFPSSFTSRDFRDGPAVLTITSAEPVSLRGANEDQVSTKLCIRFEETNRFWYAGKGEACPSIALALGSTNTDDWIGRRVELFEGLTDFGGKEVDCIRARAALEAKPPASDEAAEEAELFRGSSKLAHSITLGPAPKEAPRPAARPRGKKKPVIEWPREVGKDDESGGVLVQFEENGRILAIHTDYVGEVLAGNYSEADFAFDEA